MTCNLLKLLALSATIGLFTLSIARADCESDLTLLETAMAAPNLTPKAKAVLDAAGVAGAAAMKKDDDATCNKAVMDGLAMAGISPPPAAPAATGALGDLSSFRAIATDAVKVVKTGDFAAAKAKIKELEAAWDHSAKALKTANLDKWTVIDKALDTAFKSVRAASPKPDSSAAALQAVIAAIDKSV